MYVEIQNWHGSYGETEYEMDYVDDFELSVYVPPPQGTVLWIR